MAIDQQDDGAPLAVRPANQSSALRAARSVAAAAAGEVIFLDRQGQVVGPRQVAFARARTWAVLGTMVAGVGLVYGALFSLPVGVAAGAVTALAMTIRLRNWPRYRAALALVSSYRWEEAHAAMKELLNRRLPPYWQTHLQVDLSRMDCLLGHADTALARLDALLPRLRATATSHSLNLRWRAEMLRAAILAGVGQLDDARRQRDAVATQIEAWEARHRRARGEIHDVTLQALDLAIAFHGDRPDWLPDDQTLHDWARAALLRNQFGSMLVYLAWAFERRGDADMARHLLSEAPARTPRSSLHIEAPRLQAWADDRREAWGLN